MPIPPRPTATHAPAYLAIVKALKAHPALASVRTWATREGAATDDDPPTPAKCPWVRLTPIQLPIERLDRASHAAPIRVLVETAVARPGGVAAADALATQLHAALFDRRHTATLRLWDAARAAGASDLVPEAPALPGAGEEYGEALISGRGSFIINVYVRIR